MLVVDRIEYDTHDILMINKSLTDGRDVGIGISPDNDFITLVDFDTNNIIAEKALVKGKEISIIFGILDKVYGQHDIDDDILTEYAIGYVFGSSKLVEV